MPPRLPFRVVAIGASAGGLEACTALLKALPVESAPAVVVIQHLNPQRRSLLREFLSKATGLPVTEAEDGGVLEAKHVYVIPPDRDATLRRGVLRLSSRQQTNGKHLPIDRFLSSLAADQKRGAVGVVLSGTGSDGAAGLEAVRAAGGVAFAQDPASAQHRGMPESAIARGCVDHVLPPEGIALALARMEQPVEPDGRSEQIAKILSALRRAAGIDFGLYKAGTVQRRIARRMELRKMRSLEQYAAYVEQNAAEAKALGQDVLIHVTTFFRDADAFSALRRTVFPKLTAGKSPGKPLRIWVPGCSSGEEAYSIAIALLEFLDKRKGDRRWQIFATDVSAEAVEGARAGVYEAAAVSQVSPGRLRRFFTKSGDCYEISKTVRARCVFARHDLAQDPPFSRLDLIACRNVLIYMEPALQRRALSVFHYALRPGGFLWLGKSEALGASAHLFTVADPKCKIYLRNEAAAQSAAEVITATREEAPARAEAGAASELARAVEGIVWQRRALAAVVVDSDLRVLHFQGNAGTYLGPPPGRASLHLFKLVREDLVPDLCAALHDARKRDSAVRREAVVLDRRGGSKTIDVEVIPMSVRAASRPDFLVLLEESRQPGRAQLKSAAAGRELAGLRQEVTSTREQLQAIIEGQQATNEELETAKEELQSSNEELTTLNDELQNRNAELGQLADDLSRLLVGVDIPVVILGGDRRIRRFTPAAERLLNLVPGDVGRPLSDVKAFVAVPELDRMISDVMDHAHIVERDIQGLDGRWYSLRMRPHKGAGNKTEGALVALMDIDSLKRGFEQVRLSRDEAVAERDLSATLLDLSGALIVICDPSGKTIGFNSACRRTSGYSFEEMKDKRVWDFLPVPEDTEPAEAVFAALRRGTETVVNHESAWIAKDGSRHAIAWSSLAHRAADGSVRRVISTGIDITRRQLSEDALRHSQAELRRLTANLLTTQEEERKRLARELHDDVNQRMAMLANEVSMLEQGLPGSAETVRTQLRSLRESVEQLSDDLRRAAQQLHPSALEHFGLVAALESFCTDFSKLYSIRLKFTHRGVPEAVPFEVSLCLYRVAQECLHNLAKHSQAKQATLSLRGTQESLVLSVIDKGQGFDPQATANRTGLGIIGMRERVRLVGGSVSIDSRPGKGTRVDVRVPLNRTAS